MGSLHGRSSVLAVRATVWGWYFRWALDGVTAGAGRGPWQLPAEPATCEAAWGPNCTHMSYHAILLPRVRSSPVKSTCWSLSLQVQLFVE